MRWHVCDYSRAAAFGFRPALQLVQNYTPITEGGRALDLGCGRGDETIFMAEQGYAVEAIDGFVPGTLIHDESIILTLIERYAAQYHLPVTTQYGRIEDILPTLSTNQYDLVVASYVLQFAALNQITLYKLVMPDIIRVLKPGGRLICAMVRSVLDPFNGNNEMMPEELRSQIVDQELEVLWRGLRSVYYNPNNWDAFQSVGTERRYRYCCWELVADKCWITFAATVTTVADFFKLQTL